MRKWFPAVLIVLAFIFSLAVYGQLPERVPTHWNIRGEVDGYSSRAFGAFFMPAVILGLWLLLRAVPHIDPRRTNIEKFRDTYETLVLLVVAFMVVLHFTALGTALGWPISVARIAPLGVGALLVVIGNLMP